MGHRIIKKSFHLLGSGIALPGVSFTNEEMAKKLDHLGFKNFDLLRFVSKRIGIKSRHSSRDFDACLEVARPGDTNPDLSAKALQAALNDAGLNISDLGYIVGHTATPQTLLPPNMSWTADLLQYHGPYAELRQACTGFGNALQLVEGMLLSAEQPPVGIIGSETGSVFFNPCSDTENIDQIVNLAQMGDGAAAVILGPNNGKTCSRLDNLFFGSIGVGKKSGLSSKMGGSGNPFISEPNTVITFDHDFQYIRDCGLTLFEKGLEAVQETGFDVQSVQWVIPHQANGRMAEILSAHFGIPQEKFFGSGEFVGNTGSASIWIALHLLRKSGKLRSGDKVLVLGAEATKFMYGGFIYHHEQ